MPNTRPDAAATSSALRPTRDVTTLSLKSLQNFVSATGQQDAKALLESGEAGSWIAGRQLIDLVSAFPAALSPEALELRQGGVAAAVGVSLPPQRPIP